MAQDNIIGLDLLIFQCERVSCQVRVDVVRVERVDLQSKLTVRNIKTNLSQENFERAFSCATWGIVKREALCFLAVFSIGTARQLVAEPVRV